SASSTGAAARPCPRPLPAPAPSRCPPKSEGDSDMRVLITGGAGFVGSHLVDACLEAGHQVVIVDDLSTGSRANLNVRARWYQVDIRSEELAAVVAAERPDVISHQAAQVSVKRSVDDPLTDASINVLGSI